MSTQFPIKLCKCSNQLGQTHSELTGLKIVFYTLYPFKFFRTLETVRQVSINTKVSIMLSQTSIKRILVHDMPWLTYFEVLSVYRIYLFLIISLSSVQMDLQVFSDVM